MKTFEIETLDDLITHLDAREDVSEAGDVVEVLDDDMSILAALVRTGATASEAVDSYRQELDSEIDAIDALLDEGDVEDLDEKDLEVKIEEQI